MSAILPKPHPRMRMNACSMSAFRSWPSGLTSPRAKHETSSKNAIVAASFSRSRVSWEPFTRSFKFGSHEVKSLALNWEPAAARHEAGIAGI